MTPEKLRDGLIYLVALILSICVHEFGHAFVADKLGDRLPRSQGRVTLNPLAHIDPVGTLLLPIVAVFSGPAIGQYILGWGKPVQISLSPRDITRKISIRTAHALVAIAGPMMNILFGLLLSGVFVLLLRFPGHDNLALGVLGVIQMNIGLCLFNLLPIPPLDGGAILARLVPRRMDHLLDGLNRYGFIILLGLLFTGLLWKLMWPAFIIEDFWTQHLIAWARG
ncbi:MAG TPA: site-2 protease family protein [Polyangia bacterium]|nr:site-2 protease family protein [Polyangia bacterium]